LFRQLLVYMARYRSSQTIRQCVEVGGYVYFERQAPEDFVALTSLISMVRRSRRLV
jgi:hypothetical protein